MRHSAGALAAARQQPYGCAYSDVRWGSTSTTFYKITIITIYISHRNVYVSGGLCVFSAPWMGAGVNLSSDDMRVECLLDRFEREWVTNELTLC